MKSPANDSPSMSHPSYREWASNKLATFAQEHPVLTAVLVAALGFTLTPLAIITAIILISAATGIGIPIVLGSIMISLPFLAIVAILWTIYVAARRAYGIVARAIAYVGSGNSVSFRPKAEAEAEAHAVGNDVRGYLELNLVKVEKKGEEEKGANGQDGFLAENPS